MTRDQSDGAITHYWGPNHEMYVRQIDGGYKIAVQTKAGDWEQDTVTEKWSPNKMFYPNSEVVSSDEWPL